MKPTGQIPDDPVLPALVAIRAMGLSCAIPALGLDGVPVELRLCGYTAGERATFEVRAGQRHFAIKAYASDPVLEITLYEQLAAAGLANGPGVRVPTVLAWDRALQ